MDEALELAKAIIIAHPEYTKPETEAPAKAWEILAKVKAARPKGTSHMGKAGAA